MNIVCQFSKNGMSAAYISIMPSSLQKGSRFFNILPIQVQNSSEAVWEQRKACGKPNLMVQYESGKIKELPFVGSPKLIYVKEYRDLAMCLEKMCRRTFLKK